ncbi:ribulokinase [Pedobacter sp. SYP-B3415]|uniref:ribulokinase n=1 Tax=Pedobacter sp. SYP-B3415 TaxID=2496641 RepID=UPI00101D24BC|nr:ribulokinase [Pedobacter sp. SYP-B3415]
MSTDSYVIGIDYGTDSVRSVLVNTTDGTELASSVYYYPRWRQGKYCQPSKNRFRQHPLDYIEGLEHTIKACLAQAGAEKAGLVKGISVDTTGSSPVAVDAQGTPLALLPGFEENPNAMFVLWKDHTAIREAAEINAAAAKDAADYLKFSGGVYSSEWFWSKLLHILRHDESVRQACYSWVEHCDWIPFLLTGGTDVHQMKRSRCAAGHKALWAETLPPNDFFRAIDPLLDGFTGRLFSETQTSDMAAGTLSSEWAERLGLQTTVVVGVGAFDAHMGAVGGQIEPYHLCKIMGTSTCDILVAPPETIAGQTVNGICGQVDGSVIPGLLGLEAGQSAFGDVYAWFKNLISWPLSQLAANAGPELESALLGLENNLIAMLSEQAAQLPDDDSAPLAIDWLNGRRTPDANQELKAAVTGLSLGTDAPALFRALAEATCFGAKSIVERFEREGVPVRGLIGIGGVAKKSPFIMQLLADVLEMPIRIHQSEHTCAIGAAMFAAVAAGIYPDIDTAMKKMGQGFEKTYMPDSHRFPYLRRRYARYAALGNFVQQDLTTNSIHHEQIPASS